MARFDLNTKSASVGTARVGQERTGQRSQAWNRVVSEANASLPNRSNALWFFFALIGGGAGVWWTKTDEAFHNPWIAALVAAGVVLALTLYYVFNKQNAPEEEGDNVYYLGLLFTLISLMLTLVDLFGLDAQGVPNAENISELLKNFGIALTSTVAGIAGRVMVQNLQRTGSTERSDFSEDTVLETLPPASASARDLERFNRYLLGRIARDLTQGANALARFHRIIRSHASDSEDYLRSHSESLRRESAAFKDTLEQNADTFAQELRSQAERTLDTLASSVGTTAQQIEAMLEQVRSANASYLAEVRETTRSFHDDIRSASRESLDALGQNFEAATKHSEDLPDRLQIAHNDYLEQVRETTKSFHDGLRSVSSQSLDALRENFVSAARKAESLPELLQAAHDSYVEGARAATRSFHDDIRSASGQTFETLRHNFDAAAKQSISLTQNASFAHQEIRKVFDYFGSGLEHAGAASSALGDRVQLATRSTEVFEQEIEKLRIAIEAAGAGAKTMASTFATISELDLRIRSARDMEQTEAAVRQIGETLGAITAEGAAAIELAATAAELFSTLTESVRTTESETRRATEALRALAGEAATQMKTLRQRPGSGTRKPWFWSR